MVFDLAGAVAQRHLLHKPQAASGTHRCLRQRVQRQSRALRLDQEKGPSTPFQRPPYHSALIPGTSLLAEARICVLEVGKRNQGAKVEVATVIWYGGCVGVDAGLGPL